MKSETSLTKKIYKQKHVIAKETSEGNRKKKRQNDRQKILKKKGKNQYKNRK